jgi:hypothetical protein
MQEALAASFDYSSTLKMKAILSYEMSINFYGFLEVRYLFKSVRLYNSEITVVCKV